MFDIERDSTIDSRQNCGIFHTLTQIKLWTTAIIKILCKFAADFNHYR